MAFRRQVGDILTSAQKSAIETADANIRQHLPAVKTAVQNILGPGSGTPDPNSAAGT